MFLGEDLMHAARDYSDVTSRVIDEEVERILREQEARGPPACSGSIVTAWPPWPPPCSSTKRSTGGGGTIWWTGLRPSGPRHVQLVPVSPRTTARTRVSAARPPPHPARTARPPADRPSPRTSRAKRHPKAQVDARVFPRP